jgi:hypothetical protein
MKPSSLGGAALVLLAVVISGCGGASSDRMLSVHKEAGPKAQAEQREPAEDKAARKIIYTATLRIVVDDFAKAQERLAELVADHKGYVIQSETSGTPGTPRSGNWKVRVPVDQFELFRKATVHLGDLDRSSVDSQDVTEEFYDLKARIKNREADEESLRKLYEKADGKMENILAVRRELQNVRLEIEREQGRLNLLHKLTEMTTLTVHLHERGAYVPAESPTFGNRAGRTISDSWDSLVGVGQWFALVVVALTPWLPVIALIGLALWTLRRRIGKALSGRPN